MATQPTLSVQIDELIKTNKIYRFQNELNFLKLSDPTRTENLTNEINKISTEKTDLEKRQEKFDTYVASIKENQYHKKWCHLKQNQKLNRIREYCKSNNISSVQEETYIKYQQCVGFCSNDLQYDVSLGKLTKITKTNFTFS